MLQEQPLGAAQGDALAAPGQQPSLEIDLDVAELDERLADHL
jgi:hypothetical protein